jgi:hypothetical protein
VSRRLVWFVVSILVVLAVLLVADRGGVLIAQSAAQSRLADYGQFQSKPTVHIHGFPFLTQAARGKYRDVEIQSDAVSFGNVQSAQLDVHLDGVSLPLSKLSGGKVTSLPVDRVNGTVEISYAEVARLSQVKGLTLARAGNGVKVTGQVNLPVLGSVAISGTGTVGVASGSLRLDVTALDVGGAPVTGAALSAISAALGSAVVVPTLPYGLTIQSVQPTDTGLQITGGATDVTLTSSS